MSDYSKMPLEDWLPEDKNEEEDFVDTEENDVTKEDGSGEDVNELNSC